MSPLLSLLIRDDVVLHDNIAQIDFDSTSDKRGSIICASVIAAFFAIVSTVLRVVARIKVGAPLKADDYWIFFGCFMSINVVISTLMMAHWGLGLHIEQIINPEGLAKAVLVSQIFYASSIVPIKISILYLYHRCFPSRNLRNLSIVIATVVILYSVILIICMLTQCIPLSHIWNPQIEAYCFDINAVYTVMAVMNVTTDFFILLLPIKYVWSLEVSRPRKIQVLFVFLLGALVCAFSIVRAVALGSASMGDQTFHNAGSAIWSEVEICVGVVSANLPCLRPLIRSIPKALGGGSTAAAGAASKRSAVGGRVPRGIELVRSPMGDDWEKMDTDSDWRPLRSPERKGKGNGFDGAIVVETTIETTYDDHSSSKRSTPE